MFRQHTARLTTSFTSRITTSFTSRSTPSFSKAALPLAAVAMLFNTACGDPDAFVDDGMPVTNNLGVRDAAIGGQFGPFAATDRSSRIGSEDDGYWQYITIYEDGLSGGNGTAFAMIDFPTGALDDAAPGTVYYSNLSEQEPVIFDDNGDTYVRVDDDTEIVEASDVHVALCGEGLTEDGEDGWFDFPADEVLVEVEEVQEEDDARLEQGGEVQANESLLDFRGEPDLLVKVTTIAWDRDEETWEPLETYQVANARFVLPR